MLGFTEYMEFDTSPCDEQGVQLMQGTDYMPAMRAEGKRMVELLEKRFPEFDGQFQVRSVNGHDFGTYLEMRFYHADTERGYAEANFVERHYPQTWDDAEPVRMTAPDPA